MKIRWFIALPLLIVMHAAHAQPTWVDVTPSVRPSIRTGCAMAYDAARQRVVLFGGLGPNWTFHGDTWEWDGQTWTRMTPATSPSPRQDPRMVYDAARRRIVLFGGSPQGPGHSSETWEWDGTNWTLRRPRTSPPARSEHGLAYDEARRRVVLFGGDRGGGGQHRDTWEWDGTDWTQAMPVTSPPAMSTHAMTYHAGRRRVSLFGGRQADTWEWDGVTWRSLSPANAPPPTRNTVVSYDRARGRIVQFGGADASGNPIYRSTWEWTGGTWTTLTLAAPAEREHHAMAYDRARGVIVMFGGSNRNGERNDTWELQVPAFIDGSGAPRPGGRVTLALTAVVDAGRPYLVGTSLGLGPIPLGARVLRLTPDDLLVVSTSGRWPSIFVNYAGVLPAGGQSTASIAIPNIAALVGVRLHSAFLTLNPSAPLGVQSVSNTFSFAIGS